jgi:hypothetical protein
VISSLRRAVLRFEEKAALLEPQHDLEWRVGQLTDSQLIAKIEGAIPEVREKVRRATGARREELQAMLKQMRRLVAVHKARKREARAWWREVKAYSKRVSLLKTMNGAEVTPRKNQQPTDMESVVRR